MNTLNKKILFGCIVVALSSTAFAQRHDDRPDRNWRHDEQRNQQHERHERQDRHHNDREHYIPQNHYAEHHNRPHYQHQERNHFVPHQSWRGNFHQDDLRAWNNGRWSNTNHNGRQGWWWIVGSEWFYYNSRVDNVPRMNVPSVIYQSHYHRNIPQNVNYYCKPVGAYYPYVTSCPSAWITINIR